MCVGGLKFVGSGAAIISRVNGWFSSRSEGGGLDPCVGVIVMAGWKGSYCSWYRSRGIGWLIGSFHCEGCGNGWGIGGGGGGGGMGNVFGTRVDPRMFWSAWIEGPVG